MTHGIKFQLGEVRSNKIGFQHLAQLALKMGKLSFVTAELDFSTCSWFDANMCAPLGVLLAHSIDKFNTVRLTGVPSSIQSILSKNQFLAGFGTQPLNDTHNTTVTYRRFNNKDDRLFADYLNNNMRGKGLPKMSADLEVKFKNSILELFVNAAMHSESQVGIFSCGQYYPQKHLLDFCVADGGIRMRRKIFKEIGMKMNSDQAIAWAMVEGNTTRQGNVPGGLGLKLIKEFIIEAGVDKATRTSVGQSARYGWSCRFTNYWIYTMNNGRIQIVSDRGFWEFGAQCENISRLDTPFPGTVINIEINTADTKSYRLSSESKN